MQIIVKCPECSKNLLVPTGSGYTSEIILTQEKKCTGCGKQIKIQIKIVAEVAKAPKAKAAAAPAETGQET